MKRVIDSSKLLPSSSKIIKKSLIGDKFLVPISNIKPKSSAIIKASDLKPPSSNKDETERTLLDEVISIHNKVIKIDKLLGVRNNILKKAQDERRKATENEEFRKRESKLEEKKDKKTSDKSLPSIPKVGFLEPIKRFLLFTAIGYLFNKFKSYIPKIIELSTGLIPVYLAFEKVMGNILNGVVDFIGTSYKAYDKAREITKSIGGENAEKIFDDFSKKFNTFANLAIILGLALAGSGIGRGKIGKGGKPSGGSGKVPTPRNIRTPTGQRSLRGSFTSRGYVPGESLSQYGPIRKNVLQRTLQRARVFSRRTVGRSVGKVLGRGVGKGVGKLAGKVFSRVPIIGGLVDFIINTLIFKEKPGRAAAKAVGSTIGAALGTFTPFPGVGTILGGFLGDIVGGALYDSLVSNEPIKKAATGGEVTRGGKRKAKAPVRKIRKIKAKPPKVKPQITTPGKSIGGKKEIEKLFPNSKDTSQMNPLRLIEGISNKVKGAYSFVGSLMGTSIDMILGQRPEPNSFKRFGDGLGYLIQNTIDSENALEALNLQNKIIALASGGEIPRSLSIENNIGLKVGRKVAMLLETMVNAKSNEILQAIRSETKKKSIYGQQDGMNGDVSGQYDLSGLEGEIYNYLLSKGLSDVHALGIMANIHRESSFRPGISEAGGAGVGLFQYTNEPRKGSFLRAVPDWQTNWKKQIDYALSEPENLSMVRPGEYQSIKFSSALEAANWWMTKWERPDEKIQTGSGPKIHAEYLASIEKYRTKSGRLSFPTNIGLGSEKGNLNTAKQLAESMGVPLYSHVRTTNPRSYHYTGQAMDFSNDATGSGTPEQLKVAKEFVRRFGKTAAEIFYTPLGFGIKKGRKLTLSQLDKLDPSINKMHYNHVHIAFAPFEKGGFVDGPTHALLGEKGREFVLDANSTKAFEENYPGLLERLNKADYKGTLQAISDYTTYYDPSSGPQIFIQKIIVEKPIPFGNQRMRSAPPSSINRSSLPSALSIG